MSLLQNFYLILLVLDISTASLIYESTSELQLDGVSDRVDISSSFSNVQGGEMTWAFRAKQISINANYERTFDWDTGTCSAHSVFVDVYTSTRMTFQM